VRLPWQHHRQPSPGPRIRSLDDLDGEFPWPDLGGPYSSSARAQVRNPLAVAVRALKVVEYAQAIGSENGDGDMALLGLSDALYGLARHGEWSAVGTLLNALELLVEPLDRPRWVEGLDPYIEPEGDA
jgi:hypothetical protein